MLKILVVDDEKFIRKGLVKIISEIDREFLVCQEASNGKEAFKLIEKLKPDIVVTDVKMPLMDGIELCRQLEKLYPNIKKIILSGFNEFDYVRESMRRGAIDYLLKPVDEKEIKKILIKIKEDICKEREKEIKDLSIKTKISESTQLLKEKFLNELVFGDVKLSNKEVLSRFKDYKINIKDEYYYSLIISVDNYRYLKFQNNIELDLYYANSIITNSICDEIENISFTQEDKIVILFSTSNKKSPKIDYMIKSIFNDITKKIPLKFSISLGEGTKEISSLNNSYKYALKNIKHKFYEKESTIIKMEDINRPFTEGFSINIRDRFTSKLKDYLVTGAKKNLESAFGNLSDYLISIKLQPVEVVNLLAEVYSSIEAENMKIREVAIDLYGYHFSYIKVIDLFDTFDALMKFSMRFYNDVGGKLSRDSKRKQKRIIDVVKEYIIVHFNEELTLGKIADVVYVNANYLSEIFKNQTGENFVDFLTRVRIEKAKKLLHDIKLKTYEVGHKVGYEDAAYFSKVFKKSVGVSPNEYRKMIR